MQISACEKQREDEKKLKEMEAEWLKEEARLRTVSYTHLTLPTSDLV